MFKMENRTDIVRVITDYQYQKVNDKIHLVPIYEEVEECVAEGYEEPIYPDEIIVGPRLSVYAAYGTLGITSFALTLYYAPYVVEWVAGQTDRIAEATTRVVGDLWIIGTGLLSLFVPILVLMFLVRFVVLRRIRKMAEDRTEDQRTGPTGPTSVTFNQINIYRHGK